MVRAYNTENVPSRTRDNLWRVYSPIKGHYTHMTGLGPIHGHEPKNRKQQPFPALHPFFYPRGKDSYQSTNVFRWILINLVINVLLTDLSFFVVCILPLHHYSIIILKAWSGIIGFAASDFIYFFLVVLFVFFFFTNHYRLLHVCLHTFSLPFVCGVIYSNVYIYSKWYMYEELH